MINRIKNFFRKSKNQLRAYNAAKNNRLTADWNVSYGSIDADIYQSIILLRARARDLTQNNDYAARYIGLLRANVLGDTGFTLQNKAKDFNNNLDEIANNEIEKAWKEFSKKEFCTISKRHTLNEMVELLLDTIVRDGEVLVRIHKGKRLNKFGFSLQIIEPDFLDEGLNKNLKDGNVVRMGVELNKDRKAIAYYFKESDASRDLFGYTVGTTGKHIRVPADEILHIYRYERANQTRGVTWFAPAMISLRMLYGFIEASLVNARVSASKMGFFTSEGELEYSGDGKDENKNITMNVSPGSFESLPSGVGFVPYDPKFPSDQHEAFVKNILRQIASALNVSYNTLANDLSDVNYSSMRSGKIEEREFYKQTQRLLIDNFLIPVFEQWLEMYLMMADTKLPFSKYEKFNQPLFQGRRWAWVDPIKDIEANVLAIKNGLKTHSQVLQEQGLDLYDVYQQLQKEKELAIKYGLEIGESSNAK